VQYNLAYGRKLIIFAAVVMLFNSTDYLIFLPVVLLLHYLVRKNVKIRNRLLLAASYLFYGWWSLWFLLLMIVSTIVDYYLGRAIARLSESFWKRAMLVLSLVMNLGLLFYFKYHAFFVETINPLLQQIGLEPLHTVAAVTLPVGISFYTFQSISYIIDVYRGVIRPPDDPVEYLAYVAFFPQLVAGPIERSPHLVPQFEKILPITLGDIQEGIWLILWGLFKKVVIADNIAPMVDFVYATPQIATAPLIILATLGFGIQIYCDFSGYSDVARGSARLMGFDIMFNFRIPYGAINIQEFWTRWHISLSTWFKDYLYIPLGGNRRGLLRTVFNLFVVMLLAGLWHGAAITFVLWGLVHAIALIIHRLWIAAKPSWARIPMPVSWAMTMAVVFMSWACFRAPSAEHLYLFAMGFRQWDVHPALLSYLIGMIAYTAPLLLVEIYETRKASLLAPLMTRPWPQAVLQSLLLVLLILNWQKEGSPFIYFQF
jgi:alginate O-acetyltransferase complex protein AlgI